MSEPRSRAIQIGPAHNPIVGPTLPVEICSYVQFRTAPLVTAISVVLVAISLVGVVLIARVLGLRRVLR